MSTPGPIVGFRCWVIGVEPAELRSVAMRYVWRPGVNDATCMVGRPDEEPKHLAPFDNCRCGLHARTTLAGCLEEYPYYPVHGYWAYRTTETAGLMALGAVLMWGESHYGTRVIRASQAQVLCMTDKVDPWTERSGSNNPAAVPGDKRGARLQAIERVCAEFGVPMVPWEKCETYAKEFGDFVGPTDG